MDTKFYILLIFIAIGASSCSESYLDRTPQTDLSPTSFWQSEKDLQLSLNKLYLGTSPGLTADKSTLDTYGESQNSVSSGNNTASNSDATYTNCYTNIRITNDFLENYESAEVTDEVKRRYLGEALFFRAFFYFKLSKRFGTVTIVDQTLDFSSEMLYGDRDPIDDVIEFIMNDLRVASDYLPQLSDIDSSEAYGRITKGANDAFASRVALYFGTLKSSSGEDGTELLTEAKSFAEEVMSDSQYSLYTPTGTAADFYQLFLEANEQNSETILAYQYSDKGGGSNGYVRGLLTDNYSNPTKNLADAFLMSSGLPIDNAASQFEGYGSKNSEFVDRDPRMYGTFFIPGVDVRESDGSVFETNTLGTFTTTGYTPKKYTYLDAPGQTSSANHTDIMVIRYGEVLLNYAEASFELGVSGAELDACLDRSINLLRDRVGMPHLTTAFVQDNGLDMQTEIRRERQVELANESFRYDDLIRWRSAITELNQDIIGSPTSSFSSFTGSSIDIDGIEYVLVEDASSRNFSEKNYLFPLPIVEWQLNENLLPDNPGW